MEENNIKNAEEYIENAILGFVNPVTMSELRGIIFAAEKNNGTKFTILEKIHDKKELLTRSLKYTTLKDLSEKYEIGVSPWLIRDKFGITLAEVKRMARLGLIRKQGSYRIRLYGKYAWVDTYNPYDVYALTPEYVAAWLVANPKGTRKMHEPNM